MSKKVIKDNEVKTEKLKHFGLKIYETVERGEKPKKLEKVGEMEYVPGEVVKRVSSFDDEIEMGRAIIVQDRMIKTEKYAPKQFSASDQKPINAQPEPEPEAVPEPEPEPEVPAISEEELEQARKEAHAQGFKEGLEKGKRDGKAEADRKYTAEQTDYINGLSKAYEDVIAELNVFQNAVNQLDDALPDIIIGMVKDIVGQERKINDNIVASVAKKSLSHLRELEKVVFLVHSDDVEHMQQEFPDYETQADKNVPKGSLKVSTNIGEMNFSIDRMLSEFVARIHEEFSQTEEG